ncbi:MAG: methylated-DNA--[protein]-cysteine S-methyltransferase [Dehalococcoidia bacterium]|nr:methylated-DNA--[protein]-cysteine S-methyltransferase [Dehalococcoidia bacterium]
MRFVVFPTRLGWIGVAASAAGLKRVTLPCVSAEAAEEALMSPGLESGGDDPALVRLMAQLRDYLSGEKVAFDRRFDLGRCSDFRRSVLEAVSRIPYGETRSYADVAREVGRLGAARAVGRVMATNPLPLVIPCHRVVASDGSLCGFGGGLEMKKALLDMERARR